jgi:hypothetical protein
MDAVALAVGRSLRDSDEEQHAGPGTIIFLAFS